MPKPTCLKEREHQLIQDRFSVFKKNQNKTSNFCFPFTDTKEVDVALNIDGLDLNLYTEPETWFVSVPPQTVNSKILLTIVNILKAFQSSCSMPSLL